MNDDRMDVLVEADNLATLVQNLKGPQLTFIPNKQADFNSFTVFTHTIKRMDYTTVSINPFDTSTIHTVLSF